MEILNFLKSIRTQIKIYSYFILHKLVSNFNLIKYYKNYNDKSIFCRLYKENVCNGKRYLKGHCHFGTYTKNHI